jgi:hypothetical protein
MFRGGHCYAQLLNLAAVRFRCLLPQSTQAKAQQEVDAAMSGRKVDADRCVMLFFACSCVCMPFYACECVYVKLSVCLIVLACVGMRVSVCFYAFLYSFPSSCFDVCVCVCVCLRMHVYVRGLNYVLYVG